MCCCMLNDIEHIYLTNQICMLQVLRDCFKQLKVLDDKPESTEDGDEDEVDASKSYILTSYIIRPKKIICFSDTARVTFKPPHQNFLLHF